MAHNLEGEFCVKAMILLPVEMLCNKVLQIGQLSMTHYGKEYRLLARTQTT
jgi:hypothetical protein